MNCELVRVRTSDGLILDGAYHAPPAGIAPSLSVDAFLLIHGTGSNFYAGGVLETFAVQAMNSGVRVLRVNTRGHDGVCSIPNERGSVKGGATYETVADCRYDVAAWIEYLVARGHSRIVLVGHSMGGVKAIYSQAHDLHAAVRAIVGISPPRFSHANFMSHPLGAKFREDFQTATDLVVRGQPDALFPARQPLPFLATAAGYIEKYGPADRYDIVQHLPHIPCPALILLGSESVATSPAFSGSPESLGSIAKQLPQVCVQIVAGADINYSSCPQRPFELSAQWLGT